MTFNKNNDGMICEIREVCVMNEKVKEQILKIRDTGLTNMFDVVAVQRIAYEMDCYELVTYIEDYRKEYVNFILAGEI